MDSTTTAARFVKLTILVQTNYYQIRYKDACVCMREQILTEGLNPGIYRLQNPA